MRQYVGLDVAMDETKIHVLNSDGKRIWRGKCLSNPDDLETVLRQRAPHAERIGHDVIDRTKALTLAARLDNSSYTTTRDATELGW